MPAARLLRSKLKRATKAALDLYRSQRGPTKVFDMERLCKQFGIRAEGVLHLGAHDGAEAGIYQRCGFRRVIWVEGYPPFFEKLLLHLKQFPGQQAFQVLISDVEGEEICFNVADHAESSTTLSPGKAYHESFPSIQFTRSEPMRARRLDLFFGEQGIELQGCNVLIVDLEGAELKALRSLGDRLAGFEWVGVEISLAENFASGPSFLALDNFLMASGFRRVETVVDTALGNALYHREKLAAADRLRMQATSLWYMYFYSRFYRRWIVSPLKHLIEP